MASLSEILNSKAEMKQQRTESRRAEREQLSQMRDGALMAITTNPDLYARFLVLQADNIGLSTGNIALSLSQMKDPTKIGTTDFWHKQGRYVMDEEMSKGAAVFVPPRNTNFRGYLMGSYYDVSQTTGRPLKETEPLAEGSDRMNAAFAALLDTAPVGFIENTGLDVPVRYNERECILEINTEYSTGQVFAALATEISFARLHDRGMNRDYTTTLSGRLIFPRNFAGKRSNSMALLHQTVTSFRNIKMFFMRGKPCIYSVLIKKQSYETCSD